MKECWIQDSHTIEEIRGNIQGEYIYVCEAGGKFIHPRKVIATHTEEENYICFRVGDKRGGFELNTGRIIIPAIYDAIILEGAYIGVCTDEKWGYVDKDGNEIFPIILDEITSFKYSFQENSTEEGENQAPIFLEAHAAVRYKQEWGFIDNKGVYKIYIPITILKNQFSNGWMIYDKGRWGIIDSALQITWQEPKKRYIIWGNRKIYFDKLGNVTSERKITTI